MSEQLNEAADRIHNDLLAEQGKVIEQQRATIEDLKRQLANADSILDEQIKVREDTIEALRQELQSVIATANLAQSKYDLVCYELGMVGSQPSEVVECIRALQDKVKDLEEQLSQRAHEVALPPGSMSRQNYKSVIDTRDNPLAKLLKCAADSYTGR